MIDILTSFFTEVAKSAVTGMIVPSTFFAYTQFHTVLVLSPVVRLPFKFEKNIFFHLGFKAIYCSTILNL